MARIIVDNLPLAAPSKGGLFAHVTPVTGSEFRFGSDVQFDPPEACGGVQDVPDWCADPRPEKDITETDWRHADPFTGYIQLQCGPFGKDSLEDKAKATLDRGIGRAAETQLISSIVADPDTYNFGLAGPRDLMYAIGLAELLASDRPGAHILINRIFIPRLGGYVNDTGTDGKLFTRQGTPVVNYSATSNPTIGGITPEGDNFWIFVIGQPRVWLADGVFTSTQNLAFNKWVALAERSGAVGYDCPAAAILATTSTASTPPVTEG